MLAPVSKQGEDFHRPVSIAGVRYSTGMDASGGRRNPARKSGPDRAE